MMCVSEDEALADFGQQFSDLFWQTGQLEFTDLAGKPNLKSKSDKGCLHLSDIAMFSTLCQLMFNMEFCALFPI